MLSHSMFQPNPTDDDLIIFYSTYSEDLHCAGWSPTPEGHADSFRRWLRSEYEESFHPYEDPLPAYAVEALPTLRRLYDEALGDILRPDPDPAP